jgi:hypothetical protein
MSLLEKTESQATALRKTIGIQKPAKNLYHTSFLHRPCNALQTPISAQFPYSTVAAYEFQESDNQFDYYTFSPIQNALSVWMRSKREERNTPENMRIWEVLGYL